MLSRALSVSVLVVALLAGGFVLGRFTAPAPEVPPERDDLIPAAQPAAPDAPVEPSRGPLLHPTQRPPVPEPVPDPVVGEPPPPPPKETVEVDGEGDAARVRVKGGAFKVVKNGANYTLVREGPWTTWHKNGAKASEGTYAGGVLDGAFTSWHSNGNVKVQATYAKGKIVGLYRGFHPDGSRYTELTYRAGVIESFRRWHPNGQLHSEFEYRSGHAHGPVREWHPNGRLALSGARDMGRKDGLWTTWDENGVKRSEAEWRLGEPGEVRIWDEHGAALTAEGAEERATVGGKYSRLLKMIPAPHDYAHYKDFRDYGWYRATASYAGVKDIPAGYWVYAYPTWYVWGDMQGAKPR